MVSFVGNELDFLRVVTIGLTEPTDSYRSLDG